MNKPMRFWRASGALALLLAGVASAQETARVRGTIERVEGGVYVVKARDSSTLRLTLAGQR